MLLGGCASSPKITQYLGASRPEKEIILDIEFVPQGEKLCGPAVLKMASKKHLPHTPFETYKEFAFHEKAEGSFKSDMISSTRRLGLAPYRIPNLEIMFQEIDQGRPVMVFQNLGLSWYPKWHYALLIGYDSFRNIVYLHSGFTEKLKMNFGLFTRTWRRGEYWSYVVVPPQTIPAHVSIEEALDNAVVFENIKNKDAAKIIYTRIAEKWPLRFEPHLGLANLWYESKNLKAAIKEIQVALKIAPNHPALLYNLAVLYYETGELKKAQILKNKTLAAAPNDQRETYLKKFKF